MAGSVIFLFAMLFDIDYIIGIGLLFMTLAVIGNLLLFFAVLFNLLTQVDKKQSVFTLYCVLINIPIGIGYISLINF